MFFTLLVVFFCLTQQYIEARRVLFPSLQQSIYHIFLSSAQSYKTTSNTVNSEDTPDVAAIKFRIKSWLDKHHNTINLDLSQDPIDFSQITGTLFSGSKPQVRITLGFKDESLAKVTSLDQLCSSFNFIALDRLPIPGLDGIPPQWEIYPQTLMSSFSEGVTLDQYDPNTQILTFTVETNFFAIYSNIPQVPYIADASAPKGTYLQVRRNIQGVIKVAAKLGFKH